MLGPVADHGPTIRERTTMMTSSARGEVWRRCHPTVLAVLALLAGCERPRSGEPARDIATPPAPDTQAAAAPAPEPVAAPKPAAEPQPTASAKQDTAPKQDTTTQTAEAPLRDIYHQPPRDTVPQNVYDGWKQYNLNCARCHGEDVLGTTIASHLLVSLKPDGPINTKELFIQVVCAGRPEKGMPAWCALGMDLSKINDIYAYVKGRSEAKIGPGRPALEPEG